MTGSGNVVKNNNVAKGIKKMKRSLIANSKLFADFLGNFNSRKLPWTENTRSQPGQCGTPGQCHSQWQPLVEKRIQPKGAPTTPRSPQNQLDRARGRPEFKSTRTPKANSRQHETEGPVRHQTKAPNPSSRPDEQRVRNECLAMLLRWLLCPRWVWFVPFCLGGV